MSNAATKQLEAWQGDFGNTYIDRNIRSSDAVMGKTKAFAEIFSHIPDANLQNILEVGPNIGINVAALQNLTKANIEVVEPNAKARETLVGNGLLKQGQVHEGFAQNLPVKDSAYDLAFTSGVLIHIAPEHLKEALGEIYRASSRYILAMEYFSQNPETISYRGRDDLLFKCDFGSLWLDLYPDLKTVGYGFFWKRLTGIDDVTWWLFEKK